MRRHAGSASNNYSACRNCRLLPRVPMQKPNAAPLLLSKSSDKSRSGVLDKGKKAGLVVVDVASGISTLDLEAWAKGGLHLEIHTNATKYTRSELESVARSRANGGTVRLLVNSDRFSSLDIEAFLKAGIHVALEASVKKFSPNDHRSFSSKGTFTSILDEKRLSSLDVDAVLKAGTVEIYTGSSGFGPGEVRGFASKGRIIVYDDAKKLSSLDKDAITKAHGIVH